MNSRKKILLSMVFLALFTLGFTAVPMATPNVPASNNVLTSLATENFLWNTTSDFNNYESNNCTIESNQLTLEEVGIAYDFTNDTIGSPPADWWYYEPEGSEVRVKASLGDHKKVLRLMDNNDNYSTITEQIFGDRTNGTVEFYFNVPDTTKQVSPCGSLFNDGLFSVHFAISRDLPGAGYFEVYSDGWQQILQIQNDTWYHIRIDFECGEGGYEGLSSDTFYVYVDETKYGPYNFVEGRTSLNNIQFSTWWKELDFDIYVDAVDYSWTTGYYPGRSYEHYGEKYYSKSIWESTVQDTQDNNPYYNNITFSSQTPANTTVYISYQDSQNNASWSGWSAWSDSTISLSKNGHRYIQVRTKLTTTDALATPVLEWINFSYDV